MRWAEGRRARGGVRATVSLITIAVAATACPAPPGPGVGDLPPDGRHVEVWSVLPPGNGGPGGRTDAHRDDQRALFQDIDRAAVAGSIENATIGRHYKDASIDLDTDDAVAIDHPRADVEIRWDRWGVPHVIGNRATDVAFGAGWATMEGRGLVAEIARAVGRRGGLELGTNDLFAALDPPRRIDYTDAELEAGITTLQEVAPGQAGAILAELDAYLEGVNAWRAAQPGHRLVAGALGVDRGAWRRADLVAALLTVVAGNASGGDELANAAALRALTERFGSAADGTYHDLRAADAPTTTHVDEPFPYPRMADGGDPDDVDPASIAVPDIVDPATLVADPRPGRSNVVAVTADRSASGHPLLVGGPQNGLTSPSLLFEVALSGGGMRSRGVLIPGGGPYVFVGRNDDAAWTSTSGETDQTDVRAELLCEPDGSVATTASMSYWFDGVCRPFDRPGAGVPRSVHGPEISRGTVDGQAVSFTRQRASAGREVLASIAIRALNRGEEDGAAGFLRLTDVIDFSGNWVYVNDRDVAYSFVGRHPVRAAGASVDLPTWGTGEWEWKGVIDPSTQPSALNPASGCVVSWNNKIAPGFRTADGDWGNVGPHRVDLLSDRVCGRDRLDLADVVEAHTLAGLADLRGAEVVPIVERLLAGSDPPGPTTAAVWARLLAWSSGAALRLDLDDDLAFDEPVVAVMDRWFERLVDAVAGRELTSMVGALPLRIDAGARVTGSSFGAGWYGIVTRDLERLMGTDDADARSPVRCGGGDIAACRAAVWRSLAAAVDEVRSAQPVWLRDDPARWLAPTLPRDRYLFLPVVFNPVTMRWSNRPAYELAVEFR